MEDAKKPATVKTAAYSTVPTYVPKYYDVAAGVDQLSAVSCVPDVSDVIGFDWFICLWAP